MNHIDCAALRFAESDGVWDRTCGNSQERWLRTVAEDLREWGFNTIGWTQEVVIITDGYHRHLPSLPTSQDRPGLSDSLARNAP